MIKFLLVATAGVIAEVLIFPARAKRIFKKVTCQIKDIEDKIYDQTEQVLVTIENAAESIHNNAMD